MFSHVTYVVFILSLNYFNVTKTTKVIKGLIQKIYSIT